MFLKRVEFIGFKSFADRTEIEFVPGVTAVVGPNGSGKSNIADGIRWVLGEQSAKSLRGAKMEDVIFAGSDTRKAVNFSEVSLTLDNSSATLPLDYSEITVTRRVYRSGESEYFINRQPCRLKDITELFMDTGLGKEAYSIIGQGRIEEILSTKSEERRGIFEEAAGIVKYKARKREAVKKLEETEANLVRVLDILNEIQEQLDPLKEQAATARVYKELKEQLKENEIGLYVYNIEQVHGKWRESEEKAKQYSESQLHLSAEVNSRDAVIEQKRWRINQLDQELDVLQQELLANVQQLEKLEGQKEVLKEREKNASENRAAIAEKLERIIQKRESLQKELEQEQLSKKELEKELHQHMEELRLEEAKWEGINQRLEGNLEELKAEYIDLLGELAALRNERKNFEQQQNLNHQKLLRVQEEIQKTNELKDASSYEINRQKQEIKNIQDRIKEALSRYGDIKRKEEEAKEREAKLLSFLRQKAQVKDQLHSRLEVLKEMQSDYSGFMQGVKEVLKARGRQLKGIHGAVAELIAVPEKFETAIEIALGGALQHVVVEDESSGRAAIGFLKQNHLGRATFLPISVMKSRRPTSADEKTLLQEEGVLGLASDLISFAETYRGVIENLLGSVVIAEHLEIANRVARKTGYRYRIVTLDGDVVNPGGSMTGGAVKQKSSNLLGRSRAIEELEKEWKAAEKDYEQLSIELNRIQEEIQNLQSQLDACREEGERYRAQEQELLNQLTRTETEYRNLEQRLMILNQDLESFTHEDAEMKERFSKLLEQLEKLTHEESQLKLAIDLAEKSKKEQESSREEMSGKITELKVVIAEFRQMLDAKLERLSRLEAEIKELDKDRHEQDQELKNLFAAMKENEEYEKNLQQEIENSRNRKAELTKNIEAKKEIRKTSHEELEQLEQDAKEIRKELRKIEEELHKEEVKANRFEVELDNLIEKLREEYELTYESAKEEYPVPNDEEVAEVRKEVFRLKRDIQALGDVNVGAIEEYERLVERHQFLTHQSEDLTAAKQSLYQVIQEMDQEMTKRFAESFEQIRYQFQRVFTRLFGGGRADLILVDPDHLLETGIDIVAQPPGKKLQNLALLSGGERALTAIALLFAILKIRPVPFCVLDEVEAALDEANVSRFARYLKEFSSETQFIVITHRKGTMEEADVLYGVTMEGSGVSKLVSVKLADLEEQGQGIA